MSGTEFVLNPVDFITVGTIGPKGQRTFHLQAGKDSRIISFIIEKEQAWALSEAITELLDDLDERFGKIPEVDVSHWDMELREPIDPLFRVAQMGLSYDEGDERVILIAQELVTPWGEGEPSEPGVVRMWCSRDQMRALSQRAMTTVKAGRPDPKQNGRLVYYWT